ncbi:adenylyltransferase/cytidyltransferase family protein [Candidatus Roizmanbacteria bacterium]|nr:adenylyltransferase/cytidyltransferase family protein [Candidatus Roizmanbacteria bacterium]
MKKYKVGFLIGRFQPFHKGHLHLIKRSFRYIDTMVIGVGSVGKVDKDNFLTYEQRKEILQKVIAKERWKDKIGKVVPLKDFYNDKLWLNNSVKLAGKIDLVIGNNEWTNRIFEAAGFPILRLGFYKRYLYEGIKIRKLMKAQQRWENRVPGYIIPLIHGCIAKLLNG